MFLFLSSVWVVILLWFFNLWTVDKTYRLDYTCFKRRLYLFFGVVFGKVFFVYSFYLHRFRLFDQIVFFHRRFGEIFCLLFFTKVPFIITMFAIDDGYFASLFSNYVLWLVKVVSTRGSIRWFVVWSRANNCYLFLSVEQLKFRIYCVSLFDLHLNVFYLISGNVIFMVCSEHKDDIH